MYSHYLDTFICVADCGSFSKAGEAMFISATAVMKQINQLESALECPLFVRTSHGLILTEAGKSYYHDAKVMITYAQEAQKRAKQAMHRSTQVIRIGVSALAPASVLTSLWPRIQRMNPQYRLEVVHFENSEKLAQNLPIELKTEYDVILTMHDEGTTRTRGISSTVLCTIPLCCAVPQTHPLAGRKRLTLRNMEGGELMLIRKGWGSEMDRLRADIEKNHSGIQICDFQTYSIATFNECVHNNRLLVAVEDWKDVHPLIEVIPVEWPYEMSFGFIHAQKPEQHVLDFLAAAGRAYREYEAQEHQP